MRRLLIITTIGIIGLMATPALAQDSDKAPAKVEASAKSLIDQTAIDADARKKIEFQLSGYHYFPTREKLESVSPNAPDILMAIAEDDTRLPSMRVKAIKALGLFEGHDKVALYFERALAEGGRHEAVTRHTLTASLRAFGDRALPWLEPYLGHPDVQVRMSAITAIGKLGGERGVQMLEAQRAFERDELARERIEHVIRPIR